MIGSCQHMPEPVNVILEEVFPEKMTHMTNGGALRGLSVAPNTRHATIATDRSRQRHETGVRGGRAGGSEHGERCEIGGLPSGDSSKDWEPVKTRLRFREIDVAAGAQLRAHGGGWMEV